MIQEVSEPVLVTVTSSGGIAVVATAISAGVSALVALALWRVSRQTYALNREMQVWRKSQFRPTPVVGDAVLQRIPPPVEEVKYRVRFSLYNPGEVPIQVREMFSSTFLRGELSLEILAGPLEDSAHGADAWVEPHGTKEFAITAVGKRSSERDWPDALGLSVTYVTAGEVQNDMWVGDVEEPSEDGDVAYVHKFGDYRGAVTRYIEDLKEQPRSQED